MRSRRTCWARISGTLAIGLAVGCSAGEGLQEQTNESAASAALAPGVELLFSAGMTGGLSATDQNEVFGSLGLSLSDDGSALIDGACGSPVSHAVRFEDLNGDGSTEVIVDFGNMCISGMAGTSVMLFVRDDSDRLRPHLGFPGLIAEVRPVDGVALPELLIGGPGFCFAVWRWNGETYVHDRNEAQSPGGCDGRGD
jgi:hypothetical protein